MADEKLGILDIKVNIDDEKVVDVEMQVSNEYNIKERTSTYLAKLAQWLWLIEGSEEKMAEAAKENKEVKKALNELEKISMDPKERERYEEREWAIMRYNVEMKSNFEAGQKDGIEIGEKKEKLAVAKKMKEINIPIEQIMQVTELSKEEIEKL